MSRSRLDAHATSADLDELHASLGHFARQLWDVQKTRVALNNRVKAMERDERDMSAFMAPALHSLEQMEAIERGINNNLERIARQHFMADWIKDAPGIGLPGFARLMGVTGPLDRFPTVSKLWKYLGMGVQDGHAPRRERGVPFSHTDCTGWHLRTCPPKCPTDHHKQCVPGQPGTAYSPQGRVLCHQLADSIVKVGKGPYSEAYDRKKAQYEAERPEWTQAHRHNAAMRYAVKCLLRDLWDEWMKRRRALDIAA